MSCEDEIHVGDIGTVFQVTIETCDGVENLSTTTDKKIIFQKPSGTILEKTASFYTDGTDGIIQYETVDGDLDEIGTWKIQGYVAFATNSYKSEYTSFKVKRNLE